MPPPARPPGWPDLPGSGDEQAGEAGHCAQHRQRVMPHPRERHCAPRHQARKCLLGPWAGEQVSNGVSTVGTYQHVSKEAWYHDSSGKAILGDFGIAQLVGRGRNTDIGTPGFRAPEVGRTSYTTDADIWSYGATLHVVATSRYRHIDRQFHM